MTRSSRRTRAWRGAASRRGTLKARRRQSLASPRRVSLRVGGGFRLELGELHLRGEGFARRDEFFVGFGVSLDALLDETHRLVEVSGAFLSRGATEPVRRLGGVREGSKRGGGLGSSSTSSPSGPTRPGVFGRSRRIISCWWWVRRGVLALTSTRSGAWENRDPPGVRGPRPGVLASARERPGVRAGVLAATGEVTRNFALGLLFQRRAPGSSRRGS